MAGSALRAGLLALMAGLAVWGQQQGAGGAGDRGAGGTPCPRHVCKCRRGRAVCNGHWGNLTELPPLPESIHNVSVLYASLGTLSARTFRHLHVSSLHSLQLKACGVRAILPDAFAAMRSLRLLALYEDATPAAELVRGLSGLQGASLLVLSLAHLGLGNLPDDFFQSPGLQNLRTLYLGSNDFDVFNDSLIKPLGKLGQLDLSNCRVERWHGSGHPSLFKITLAQNKIVDIPNFCDAEGRSLYPRLRDLSLSTNSLVDLTPTSFDCVDTVQKLDLSSNKLLRLRANTFSRLPRLDNLLLSHNKQLATYEELAFNSSSLKRLMLMYNHRWTKGTVSPDMFRWCPNLERLYLKQTKMGLPEEKVRRLLLPLRRVSYLNLANSNTFMLPRDTFPHLPLLQHLDMAGNRINGWQPEVFSGVRRLSHLSLSENNIQLVTRHSFPDQLWRSLRRVNLGRNPYTCVCDLEWWAEWLQDVHTNRSVRVDNYPQDYKCRSPKPLYNKLLQSYRPSWLACLSPYIILAMVLPCVLVVLVLVLALLYRYRINVKLWVYLLCRRRRGYQPIPEGQDFLYEAFIAYSKDDSAWVVAELLPLEKELGLKLCIHQRDFRAGWLVVDNILGNMEASRKVFLVLSNSFAGSEWCQFELQEALEYFLRKRKQVVLVLLEPIEARHLSRPLRLLLERTTYLEWRDCASARQLLRERLSEPFSPERGDP